MKSTNAQRSFVVATLALAAFGLVVWLGTTVPADGECLRNRSVSAQAVADAYGEPAATSRGLAAELAGMLSTLGSTPAERGEQFLREFVASLDREQLQQLLVQSDSRAEENVRLLRRALLLRLVELDPKSAARLILAMSDSDERKDVLPILLDTWNRLDPAGAAEWLLLDADAATQSQFAPVVARALERSSAHAAASFASALPDGATRDLLLDRALAKWTGTDPDSALHWARSLADGPAKERALIHLSYRLIDAGDPRQVLEYARAIQSATNQLVTTLVSQWVRRDPTAASAWAVQLPEGPQRSQVLASLTAVWAEKSPRDAAAFAATLPAVESRNEALVSAVSGWARQAPHETAQWVSTFPDDTVRALAIPHVVPVWMQRDAAAAAEWIAWLPDGVARDLALDIFSSGVADRYPSIAFTFAQAISEPATRDERVEFVARRWLSTDSKAATAAILESKLPEKIVSRLLPSQP